MSHLAMDEIETLSRRVTEARDEYRKAVRICADADDQASTLGVNDVFNMLGLLYLILIPFVWFAKPPFGARAAPASH